MSRLARFAAVVASLVLVAGSAARAQEVSDGSGDRGPRFLLALATQRVPLDVSRAPVLAQRLRLQLDGVTRKAALAEIARQAGLKLVYGDNGLDLSEPVRLRADGITVAAALTDVLLDTGMDVVFSGNRQVALVRRVKQAPRAAGSIVGRVVDAATNLGVPSVEILIEGIALHAFTNDSGQFRISDVPPGTYTLTVRRIGYELTRRPVTVNDGETVTVDVSLKAAPTKLAEIVTTATGTEPRYRVGNVIGTINADSVVREAPITNLNDLLQGRTPGLQVYFAGGNTGQASPIRIRGTNSFALSNNPIVMVDGIRVEASGGSSLGSVYAGLTQSGGRLSDINPDEIESIDVVKGPSAATLYGTDAANGVIVITTKRGIAGPPRWNFWGEGGTVTAADHFTPLYWSYGTNLSTGAPMHCLVVQISQGVCRQDSLAVWNPLEDAATSPLGSGRRWVAGAQVSGGVQRFRYFVSAERENETGYLEMPAADIQRLETTRGVTSLPDWQLRPNALTKTSVRANVGTSIGKVADVQLSNGLVINDTRIPSSIVYYNGALGFGPPTSNGVWAFAPEGDLFSLKNDEQTTRYTSSLVGTYRPKDWLRARGTVGLDHSSGFVDGLALTGEVPFYPTGIRQNVRSAITLWSADANVSSEFPIGASLTSKTTVGVQYNRRDARATVVSATGLPPGSQSVAGATAITGTESTTETVIAGGFAEQTFGLGDRLFATGALRFDGASSFGRDFSTAVYPKASLSWVVREGSRGPSIPGVTSLRLRAAYGTSGVQPGAVDALAKEQLSQAIVNGQVVTGATLSALGNPDLKPERQTEIEAGLDAQLFGGRVGLELTVYNRQSHDAIVPVSLPPSLGGYSVLQNLGEVRNRGLEGSLTARAINAHLLTLDLSLNGNLNQNRLLTVGGVPVTPFSQNQPGYPLYSAFYLPIVGFGDANGDGIITPGEVQVDASKPQFIAPYRPQRSLTQVTNLGLFGGALHVSAMFDYRGGYDIADFATVNDCAFGTCRAVNDPAAPLGDQAAAQAFLTNNTFWGFYQDGRFIRFRELSVTCALPSRWARWFGARSAMLAVTGRNLALFGTKYTGGSPESVSLPGLADETGLGNPSSPPARYWLVRLNLGF
jgi:TonB-linked SusC/RagA family outer membrane protein